MARIALVTGSSSGIGLSCAALLARAGFHVTATVRDLERAKALRARIDADKLTIEVAQLDVTDPASVQARVDEVIERHGTIDVLVNNAGAGFVGGLEHTSDEDLQRTFDVNFHGVWRTTRAVLPHMRKARTGRIISLSSIGGVVGQPFNDAYCAAKFAVEGLMESLAPAVRPFGIYVSLIEPGPVLTEFVNNAAGSMDKRRADDKDAYRPLVEAYLSGSKQAFATLGQQPDDVAKVVVEAATAPSPHLRYQTSEAIRGLAGKKLSDPSGDSLLAISGARLQGVRLR